MTHRQKKLVENYIRRQVRKIISEQQFTPLAISRILKEAGIKFDGVEKISRDEYSIKSGIEFKVGTKWEQYEESVYTALENAGWKGENDSISIYID